MAALTLPAFTPDRPAAEVDAALRQALAVCGRARECAVLWFAEVQRRALYRALGHASLQIYAAQALGFTDNRYWQFKRLADDLDRLPALKSAVAAGEVGWTKAQQVARVATPATQAAWVDRAKTVGRRELEREVRAARATPPATRQATAGGAPQQLALAPAQAAAPAAAGPVPGSLTLRGDTLQLARFEALLEKARKLRAVPAGVDRLEVVLAGLEALVEAATHDALVADTDGHVRGESVAPAKSPRAAGPRYQVIVHQCPDCAAATVTTVATGAGERRLAPAQAAAVACDARVRAADGPNRATIAPAVRARVLARDRHRCATPGCGSARFLEVHHVVPRSRGGTNDAANLVTLCSRCHGFVHEREAAGLAPAQVGVPGAG
ncbi:MAG: HNH endonuclease [bacterium]|nr:HNH endonuclease [bacterium]